MNQPIDGKLPGVMVPIPQYPLYSATLAEFNMHQIGYYLDEDAGWGLDLKDLQRAVDEARKVSAPRAIVIINPGNPTGQVLTRDNIEGIIKFAHKENLFLFADEVYQVSSNFVCLCIPTLLHMKYVGEVLEKWFSSLVKFSLFRHL